MAELEPGVEDAIRQHAIKEPMIVIFAETDLSSPERIHYVPKKAGKTLRFWPSEPFENEGIDDTE